MKNARKYERAARKLLSVRGRTPRRPAEADDPVAGLVRAVLEADGAHKRADKAMDALRKEYVELLESGAVERWGEGAGPEPEA